MAPIRKAVIPVAGLGTRFLPATKAQPKEMLPLVDKPVIQHVVEEAIHAGIQDIVLVTGRGKQAIENHFDVAYELEDALQRRGRQEDLELVRGITRMAAFAYVRQGEPLGLGHAVLCARTAVGDAPFALLLGDDVFEEANPALGPLLEAHARTGKSVVGVQRVPHEQVNRYGIVNAPREAPPDWEVQTIVEKPEPGEAPSDWAVVGRYVLTPEIFRHLDKLNPGSGGEIQLTDGIASLMQQQQILAYRYQGTRYDCGSKLGYLQATVELGMRHPEVGKPFSDYLKTRRAP